MQSFQRKKKLSQIIYSPITLVILLVVVALLGRSTLRVFLKERESAQNLAEAKEELQKLQNKQEDLDQDIKRLSTPEGVEEELRSKYAIKKGDEALVVIVDDKASTTEATSTAKQSWWQNFLGYFK